MTASNRPLLALAIVAVFGPLSSTLNAGGSYAQGTGQIQHGKPGTLPRRTAAKVGNANSDAAASENDTTSATNGTSSIAVRPGPFQRERRHLLHQIQQAERQGIGIANYTTAFADLEELVRSEQEDDVIKSKVDALAYSLKQQIECRRSIQSRPVPQSTYLGSRGKDSTRPASSEGGSGEPLSYSGLYVNIQEPDIFNFLRFYADGSVRAITFVLQPEESKEHLFNYVKANMHNFSSEASSGHVETDGNFMKFACGGLNYVASTIPGGLGAIWTSTVTKKRGKCGYYFIPD